MIARVGRQGSSFKGVAQYLLHDKRAATADRVAHVETRNLPTQDPELGWRVMAATAMDSDRLKREAGVDRRGRKLSKPVFHISLSWHPDQNPDHEHMARTMDGALATLGLQNAQAVYVVHRDEPHAHIHAFVNLVDPDNGRSNSVRYSKRKLSKWAEDYERAYGIYCEKRITNSERRLRKEEFNKASGRTEQKRTETARRRENAQELKAEITRRYQSADNGKAFQASLRELGFEIAQGKRIVFVGPDGKTHSATRQLDGVTAANLRKKLKGLELAQVDDIVRARIADGRSKAGDSHSTTDAPARRPPPVSQEHAREEVYFDRDAQLRSQDERVTDAGIRHQKAEARTGLTNRLQDAHHDQWGAFFDDNQHRRHRLDELLDGQYGAHERALRQSIAAREQSIARSSKLKQWMTRNFSREHELLENDRQTLANIEQRRAEAVGALAVSIEQRRAATNERHERERADLPKDFTPLELDSLVRSIEQQEEITAPVHAAADPSDNYAHGATSRETEQDVERSAFMERLNADGGERPLGLGGPE
jgi:hypothetical protein